MQYITSEAPAHKPFIRGYRIPHSFFSEIAPPKNELAAKTSSTGTSNCLHADKILADLNGNSEVSGSLSRRGQSETTFEAVRMTSELYGQAGSLDVSMSEFRVVAQGSVGDFLHPDGHGRRRKAIKVREVSVTLGIARRSEGKGLQRIQKSNE